MKTVDEMIDDIIRREGGYVNHPADRGGPTKYGITLATLRAWTGDPDLGEEAVRLMPESTARAIYKTKYFDEPKIGKLPPALQPFMFDAAVNHGPVQAVKFLQAALCDLGWPTTVDGKIGPQTITNATLWVEVSGSNRVLELLVAERRRFYHQIVAKNPSQEVFLKGWLNRLAEFEPSEVEDKLHQELSVWKQRALRAEARLADIRRLTDIIEA